MHGTNWLRLWWAVHGAGLRLGPVVTLRLAVEEEFPGHLLLPGCRPVPGLALLGRRCDPATGQATGRMWVAFGLGLRRGAVTPDLEVRGRMVPVGGARDGAVRLLVDLPLGTPAIPVLLDAPET